MTDITALLSHGHELFPDEVVTSAHVRHLDLPEGARVADLLERYGSRSPRLVSYFDVIAVAVNQEYAERQAALHDRDEVALIPPVSGGVSGPAAAALSGRAAWPASIRRSGDRR